MRTSTSALLLGLMVTSCTHVQPKEMTVDEHRKEAALHEARAREERSQYDPSASARPSARPQGPGSFGMPGELGSFNPTDEHLRAADAELKRAHDHHKAADALRKVEDRACEGVPEAERAACPLFASRVSLIELTKTGFVLTFQTHIDVDETYQRLSCHLAYATATGFDRPSCGLFIKGTSLKRVDERGIAFLGDSEATVKALHAQARRLFLGLISSNDATQEGGEARASR